MSQLASFLVFTQTSYSRSGLLRTVWSFMLYWNFICATLSAWRNEGTKEDGKRKSLIWDKISIHATMVTTVIPSWNKEKNIIKIQIWRCKDTINIHSNPTEFKKTGSFHIIPLDKRVRVGIHECCKVPCKPPLTLSSPWGPHQSGSARQSPVTPPSHFPLHFACCQCQAGCTTQALRPQEQGRLESCTQSTTASGSCLFFNLLLPNSISWAMTTAYSKADTEFCFDLKYLHI